MHSPLTILAALAVLSAPIAAAAGTPGSQFTRFGGFELGSLTLAQVRDAMAPAEIVRTGDAGETLSSLCYRTPAGYVLFLAGELDGLEKRLGGFGLVRSTQRGPCATWPTRRARPQLDIAGLRLGMNVSQLQAVVGTTLTWNGTMATASFESKRKINPSELARLPGDAQEAIRSGANQDYFDVVVYLDAEFKNGQAVKIEVWKSETL